MDCIPELRESGLVGRPHCHATRTCADVRPDRETVANLTGNPAATRTPIVSAAGRMVTLGGGIQLLGGPLWLTVCVGLGSSFVL